MVQYSPGKNVIETFSTEEARRTKGSYLAYNFETPCMYSNHNLHRRFIVFLHCLKLLFWWNHSLLDFASGHINVCCKLQVLNAGF